MENSIENIDLIILEKEYHQLTTDEKLAVNDFIAKFVHFVWSRFQL